MGSGPMKAPNAISVLLYFLVIRIEFEGKKKEQIRK
jgi:hypothetical protein